MPSVPRLVLPRTGGEPTLRPATAADDELLTAIYASTRAEELDLVAWPPGERQAFQQAQFLAQRRDWASRFPGATHDVVELGGQGVGRLVLHVDDARVLVVDVALLPVVRGRGVGTIVLRGVLADADARARPVRLHVESTNRARRLYRRLGFEVVGRGETHLEMERAPDPNYARRRECT